MYRYLESMKETPAAQLRREVIAQIQAPAILVNFENPFEAGKDEANQASNGQEGGYPAETPVKRNPFGDDPEALDHLDMESLESYETEEKKWHKVRRRISLKDLFLKRFSSF